MKNVMDLFSLKGNVTAATGAAGYMCGSFVEAIAQAGSDVALIDRPGTEERLEAVAKELHEKYGVEARGYVMDVSDEKQVEATAKQIAEDFGKIDGLVNAAGVNHHSRIENYTMEDIERVFNINVAGTFICSKHFGAYMRKQKKGSIVNICSTSGNIVNMPPQVMAAYCTSKGGVKHMTHAFAAEWGEDNVRCNAISPGLMEQGMSNIKGKPKDVDPNIVIDFKKRTPMHRACAAWELCGALIYFLSDASSFTTGAEILVDGGYILW